MNAVNLCVAGGLGLISVCNGRLVREGMFNDVFLTPYPGDHGITKGCCAYGLLGNRYSTSSSASLVSLISSEADDEVKERDDLDNDNANDKDKDKDSDNTTTTTTTSKMTTTKGKDLPPPLTPYGTVTSTLT